MSSKHQKLRALEEWLENEIHLTEKQIEQDTYLLKMCVAIHTSRSPDRHERAVQANEVRLRTLKEVERELR